MDPELQALLARLVPGEGVEPLTDEELAHARSEVVATVRGIGSPQNADDLEAIRQGADVIRTIDTEVAVRAEAASTREAEAAELLAGLDLGGDDDDPIETPADAAPEDVVPAPVEIPEVVDEVPEVLPVAASAEPEPVRLPSITRLAARQRPRRRAAAIAAAANPDGPGGRPRATQLVASGDLPGLSAGQPVTSEEWARGVARKYESIKAMEASSGQAQMLYLGHVGHEYDESVTLDRNESSNRQKMNAAAERDAALLASGGICGPVAADYNVSAISVADRPVRNGLTQLAATRGGLRYIRPHTLAQTHAQAPASIWTQATDANPGQTVKGFATYTCNTVVEDYVDAIVKFVKLGNFASRYFPEQIDEFLATVDAEHARLAESTLLAAIGTGSTATTADSDIMGATPDVLSAYGRAASAYRYRHRMAVDATLELFIPAYVRNLLRADIARELPGTSTVDERFAIADAQIDSWFEALNLDPTWFMDNPTGAATLQGFVVQGAGMLLPWPDKIISYMFHPGAWVFLDGGELNLGLFRDSTLVGTNDAMMFSETFEKAIFKGHESLQITLNVCASGLRAGSVDSSIDCRSGS